MEGYPEKEGAIMRSRGDDYKMLLLLVATYVACGLPMVLGWQMEEYRTIAIMVFTISSVVSIPCILITGVQAYRRAKCRRAIMDDPARRREFQRLMKEQSKLLAQDAAMEKISVFIGSTNCAQAKECAIEAYRLARKELLVRMEVYNKDRAALIKDLGQEWHASFLPREINLVL